jgi:diguanylate cyclase (GGDEF)-like protein
MAFGRSKFSSSSAALLAGPPVLNVVPAVRELRALDEQRRERERIELQSLRTINAQLLRELALLRQREAEALKLADRDGLTGLYNRRRMLELLEGAISEAAGDNRYVGLLFVDLNGFKAINDEYGHAAGDRVLTTVAMRVSARVRIGDLVCRYGGDEFVVVLPNIPDAGSLTQVADTIRERVALPYWVGGSNQHLSASIGEALYPHDADNAAGLIHHADQAMYRMKTRRPSAPSRAHAEHARRREDRGKNRDGGAI